MRIVHGSDWHWEFKKIPEADLYVFTGDMLDNYPVVIKTYGFRDWVIEPEIERKEQNKAIKDFVNNGGFRQLLGSHDSPIICVRGNHDFVDLAPLFDGCNLVHEFVNNEVIEVLGKKVSGHRGIPYIYGGWNDELHRPDLMDRVRAIPENIDMLLTHYPPALILDAELSNKGKVIGTYGMEGMSYAILSKMNSGGIHFFGHVHGAGGRTEVVNENDKSITFSNAATAFNIIDTE